MRASKVFSLTVKFIASKVNYFFSLGYERYNQVDNNFLIPLFLLGKGAKYLIGFPLGIFLGSLAGLAVALFNCFRVKKDDFVDDMHEVVPPTEIDVMAEELEAITSPTKQQSLPALSKEQIIAQKKNDLIQHAVLEKKTKFNDKITTLLAFINDNIEKLKPNYEKHKDILSRKSKLESNLDIKKATANTAKKISHYKTSLVSTGLCACGKKGIGGSCRVCRAPFVFGQTQQTIPVYVPDEERRALARKECEYIEKQLQSIAEELVLTTGDYNKINFLWGIKSNLESKHQRVKTITDHSDLLSLLTSYKAILKQLEEHLRVENFKKGAFLPKSDYATLFCSAKYIRKLTSEENVFEGLPEEIVEKIALTTVSPQMPENEAKDYFRLNC